MHGPADNDKTFFQPPLPLYPAFCMKLFEGFSIQLLEPLLFSCAFFFYIFLSFSFDLRQPLTSAYNFWLSRVRHGYIICWLIPYSVCAFPMYTGERDTCWWVSYLELVKERSSFCLSSNELWIRWTERVKQMDGYTLWIYETGFLEIFKNQ